MKRKIRVPYFEVGIKNYLYGEDVLRLALAAEKASKEYDIDVIFIAPYADIRMVAENTERIFVFAPYMDNMTPGRGMADVLPESIKAAGADGVVLNHCERPISISALRKSIDRARELDMYSFVCADTITESKAIAHLNPDIINPEPSEKIGKASGETDFDFIRESIQAIKSIQPSIIVEQAAGISTGQQVYDIISSGAEACGAASGVCCSEDPRSTLDEMIFNVRRALDDKRRSIREKDS